VVKILQGSVVTQSMLRGLTIHISDCKFPIVYIVPKIMKIGWQ